MIAAISISRHEADRMSPDSPTSRAHAAVRLTGVATKHLRAHNGTIRAATRPERNMIRTINGDLDKFDVRAGQFSRAS